MTSPYLGLLFPIALVVFTVAGSAQSGGDQARLTAAEIAALPKVGPSLGTSGVSCIRTTVLSGDPAYPGLYTIMLHVPAGTRIAAHSHRDTRSAVVISGTWHFGFGSTADDVATKALGPGSFYTEPADVPHFARTGAEAVVVYITGMGPTDTRYVDTSYNLGR